MRAHVLGAVVAAATSVGCRQGPPTPELEPSPRTVKVGNVSVKIRLSKGAEQDQAYPASSRFVVPGRGGAIVVLSLSASASSLADATRGAAERVTADGTKPIVVRSETKGARTYVTTQGPDGKVVRVDATVPLSAAASGTLRFLSCHANVTRSSPLADIESTRRVLETICESLAQEP